MKHLALALIVALFVYGLLSGIGPTGRSAVWRRIRRHIAPVLLILLVVAGALVAMFYSSSINVL